MELWAVFIGGLFLMFDASLLKKREEGIYERVFYISLWQTAIGMLLLFLAASSSGESGSAILQIIFILVLFVYLLRRKDFFTFLNAAPPSENPPNEKLELALSTVPIVGLWMICMIVVSLVLEVLFSTIWKNTDELAGSILLSEISVVVLLILIYRATSRRKELKFLNILGLETQGLGPLKGWILPAVFALGYAIVSSTILNTRPIQPMTPLQELLGSTTSMKVFLFFIGTAVLTAPFFEEVIFRGYLFYVLRPFKGVIFTVVFITLLFGAMHVDQYWGDWAAIAVVACFGLALTLLRAWTGSAVPGMVAHYFYNATLMIYPVIIVIIANPVYFDYQMNYYRLNNAQKEEKLLTSIGHNPKFGDPYNDLAWLYSEQDIKLDRALEFIDQGLALDPNNYAFRDTKAEVLFKMGRINEAIAIEEELLENNPNDVYLQKQLKRFKQEPAPALRPQKKEFDI